MRPILQMCKLRLGKVMRLAPRRPGFKAKDHTLPIIPGNCLNCTIISTSPKGRRRTRRSLATGGEGERQGTPSLDAQPLLHLLSTTNAGKQIPSSIFPLSH